MKTFDFLLEAVDEAFKGVLAHQIWGMYVRNEITKENIALECARVIGDFKVVSPFDHNKVEIDTTQLIAEEVIVEAM